MANLPLLFTGGAGKKKNDADEEDDDSVEADAAQSPPDRARLAASVGATPVAASLTAAQAREAAQRERERLNLALGRVRQGRSRACCS